MNNYKIKVNNEAESKEAQELFFELGYGWHCGDIKDLKNLDMPHLYAYAKSKDITCGSIESHFINHESQEITLPQLRDIVVLKRNDVSDENAQDGTFHNLYKTSDGVIYFYHHPRQEWMLSHINEKPEYLHLVKPISEQQMASHNIEQQALQANHKLFLDPTQGYMEIEWDGTFFKPDYLIKVPEGAVEARINGSGGINFINENDDYMNNATCGERIGTHRGKHDIAGHAIVWQRTQDEPFLTPESVALDVQIGGNHYKKMKIQPVEFALANGLDFCQGSAIKYILRHAEKGGKQDLEKAKHFIDLMIQHYYG